MQEFEALELYDISQNEITKINEFCEKYILDYKFNIVDLMYYDGLLLKIDTELKTLAAENIINLNYKFEDIIENFSKNAIYELIPNIKDIFISKNIPFKKSIKADDLRALIANNKKTFESYFINYAIVTLEKNIEKFINKYQEYIEEYAQNTHKTINNNKYAEYKYSYETYGQPAAVQIEKQIKDTKKAEDELNPLPLIFGIICFIILCIFIGANL